MEFIKNDDPLFQKGGVNELSDDEDDGYSSTASSDEDEEDADGDGDGDDDDEDDDDDDDDIEDLEENLESIKINQNTSVDMDSDNESNSQQFSDDDEDDEEDDLYLQKFTNNINVNDLEKLHPGIQVCNNDEVSALSRVVRDAKGKICDPMHTTVPFLTKYEKARIIGARAEQLDRGSVPMIKLDPEIINGRVIAEMELEQKKIPFVLARPLPNGKTEYWRVEDLEYV